MDDIDQERKRKREQELKEYHKIVSYQITPVPSPSEANPRKRSRQRKRHRFRLRYIFVPLVLILTFLCYFFIGKMLSETNAVNKALHRELTEKQEQLALMQDELTGQEDSVPLPAPSAAAESPPPNQAASPQASPPDFSVRYPLLGSSAILHGYGPYTAEDGSPEFSPGLDLGTPGVTSVIAAADGTVLYAGQDEITGGTVQIDHGNGYITYYCYTQSVKVVSGQTVKAGQIIAGTGDPEDGEASHMEFRVMYDGSFINPEEILEIKG